MFFLLCLYLYIMRLSSMESNKQITGGEKSKCVYFCVCVGKFFVISHFFKI